MGTVKKFLHLVLVLFAIQFPVLIDGTETIYCPFRENDPASYVRGVSTIDGGFTALETDLSIIAPDPLILTRFYSSKDALEDTNFGGWRIFPQCFLVLGQDSDGTQYAFTGERSGAILTYSGRKDDVLTIDMLGAGMTNTYAGAINGQTNHRNNHLKCKGATCELTLGDGTKRIYRQITEIADDHFSAKIPTVLKSKVSNLKYFQLISEKFPSKNILLFTYKNGRLSLLEMKDSTEKKLHASIQFDYECTGDQYLIKAVSSDERTLEYRFQKVQLATHAYFILKSVSGSHAMSVSYEYELNNGNYVLTKKILPEGRAFSIDYDDAGRVKHLKEPITGSHNSEIVQRFSYAGKCTECFNAMQLKTRYIYDVQQRLISIEQYDKKNELYRIDRKYWGESQQDSGILKSIVIGDGKGRVISQRTFEYDEFWNIEKEWLYGNLTGEKEIFLNLDEKGKLLNSDQVEHHVKTYEYSKDGLNLLSEIGDCKGGRVLLKYKPGTNLLIKKIIESNEERVLKRHFYSYNQDGVCDHVIEDDGSEESSTDLHNVRERHITAMQLKKDLPGISLPLVIEKKALNIKTRKEGLVQKLVHSYSPQGLLQSTHVYDDQNALAYSTSKTYSRLGQIKTETDPENRQTIYEYDGIGNQILITIPDQDKITERKFDVRNRCFQVLESAGGLKAVEQYQFDELGQKISSTDRFGQITQFQYDEFGRLEKIISPSVLDEQQQPITPTVSYSYDLFGNVLLITDPKGYKTSKSYNIRGSPTNILHPDGTCERFKYDREGSLHRSLTRENQVTIHEYDELGRISYQETSKIDEKNELFFLKGHSYKYNGFRIIEEKEIKGIEDQVLVTQFQHSERGLITSIIQYDERYSKDDPSSHKTIFSYDSLGREVSRQIWFGPGKNEYSRECCQYDALNQIKKKWNESANGHVFAQRHYEYNNLGRCTEEYTLHNGQKQTLLKMKYDPFGELISYSDALENESTIVIDYTGDALRKNMTDSLFNQTEMTFDALGRISSAVKKNANGQLISSQKIFYDALGNKSAEINDILFQGNSLGEQTTCWEYGPMRRLDAQIEAQGTADEKRTKYTYDRFGRLITKMLPGLSDPLVYSYNKQGFICQIAYKPEDTKFHLVNTYSYDGAGNIIHAETLDGISVERNYDVFGQMTKEIVQNISTYSDNYYTLRYQYDRIGRIKKIQLPDRSAIAYTHDAWFGRKVSRLTNDEKIQYSHIYDCYDDQGRLIQETSLTGSRTSSYDSRGHRNHFITDYFSENIPDHGYDCSGNLLEIQRTGTFPCMNRFYTYDSLSQLVMESSGENSVYVYDSLFNCRFEDNDQEHTLNHLNQLIDFGKRKFSYDALGNLSRKKLDDKEIIFTFDVLSHLIYVENMDFSNTALQFFYDAFGRRITKSQLYVKGGRKSLLSTCDTFYFAQEELGVIDETGTIQELRVPGYDRNGISKSSIAIEINEKVYAPLHDMTGNVIALIDPKTQNVVESYTYTAFSPEKIYGPSGNQISRSAIGNPWRYKEKRLDEEIGLFYFGARYYDPQNHRWISPDPIGHLDGPNKYAFVRNNPLRYHDRMGFAKEEIAKDSLSNYFYGEVETHCYCETHRTCKRGGDIGNNISSVLPNVRYDNTFEKIWRDIDPYLDRSAIFDLGREQSPDFGIGFINGVWNTRDMARESAEYISHLAGEYNVHYVHNASHGNMIDLLECYMGLNCIATEPVQQLHKMWDDFFAKGGPDSRFLMIGHSQGVIHLRNGLLAYPEDKRNRIFVVAIAPGAYVYKRTCADVVHYITQSRWRDFVPRIDRSGFEREYGSVIELPSNSWIPLKDHCFDSLIYEDYILDEINKHLK